MIPSEISEDIYPHLGQTAENAALLHHDCGVSFQFHVDSLDGHQFVITQEHLKTWRTKIHDVAAIAGENCFSYNDLEPEPPGVYRHNDGNTLAILFAPGTFLEHNSVDGRPLLLLISDSDCILTGSNSAEGLRMIGEHMANAIATSVVTIDKKWERWIESENAG